MATVRLRPGLRIQFAPAEICRPRRAPGLRSCLDFETANKSLFYGLYYRLNSYFDNSELAATGLPEGRELDAPR